MSEPGIWQATRDLEAGEAVGPHNAVELRPAGGTGAWCPVCEAEVLDGDVVECADWPGRAHHVECRDGCVECRNAIRDDRRGV